MASSSLVFRSEKSQRSNKLMSQMAYLTLLTDPLTSMTHKSRCSSVVEHFLGREEVVSSILTNGSNSGPDDKVDYPGRK